MTTTPTPPRNYTEHMLIAFGGGWVGEASDGWECTLRVSSNGGSGGVLQEDNYLADIVPNLKTWFQGTGNYMSSYAQLAYVKANRVGADGRYVDKAITHRVDFSPVTGGRAAVGPQFTSICATLQTAALRGRGHVGRIYLPNASIGTVTAMQISSATATGVCQSVVRLLQLIKNPKTVPSGWVDTFTPGSYDVSPIPAIYSGIDASVHVITGVSADTVYDVQRRRKEQVKGTRVATVPLTA